MLRRKQTIQLADERDDDATLIATELHPHRVTLLKEGLGRAGIQDVDVLERDASNPKNLSDSPFDVPFDLILLDAPCSGLGTIQRHPELKYVRPEASLEGLQRSLLTSAYEKLTPGGVLIYSLCTFREAETDAMVHWMLAEHTDLEVLEPQLPPNAPSTWSRQPVRDTVYRTWSHRDGCDSFFWVAFQRRI